MNIQFKILPSVLQFVVEDSVEERMMALQDQKRKLMQGAFGQKQTADDKRTNRIRDIKTLMDLWDVDKRIGDGRLIPGPYNQDDREGRNCGIVLNCELNFVSSANKATSVANYHFLWANCIQMLRFILEFTEYIDHFTELNFTIPFLVLIKWIVCYSFLLTLKKN